MPKLYSSQHILRILKQKGFQKVDQTGSHIKLRKDSMTVIVPAAKKEIPIGTFGSILRQSKLRKEDFE